MPVATHEELIRNEVAKRRPQGVPVGARQNIVVCTPTRGMVSMWWHTSICDLVFPMNTGKALIPGLDRNGGEIAEIRNRLVTMAKGMETDQNKVHSILWLDDDVIFYPSVLLALAAHDRDVVSGVYFCKGQSSQPLLFGGPCCGTLPYKPATNEHDGCEGCPECTMEAWGWSNGLSLVKMDVYRRMEAELELGKDKYGCPLWYEPSTLKVENGNLTMNGTEDFPFFEKVAKIGVRPLIDLRQAAFGFHYDHGADVGYPKPQWENFIRREPVLWPAKGERQEVVWK
jgi:hypothetical protein